MKHASVDKAKRVSSQCRNHGSCPYCQRSRTIGARRLAQAVLMTVKDCFAGLPRMDRPFRG